MPWTIPRGKWQGLMWLALDLWQPSYLCLWHAGITGVCHRDEDRMILSQTTRLQTVFCPKAPWGFQVNGLKLGQDCQSFRLKWQKSGLRRGHKGLKGEKGVPNCLRLSLIPEHEGEREELRQTLFSFSNSHILYCWDEKSTERALAQNTNASFFAEEETENCRITVT